ncbi:sulfatase-like hydrolase/transferase [Halomicrococcus sp. SG-WS-1]|uniref:sulfatase-like hydrolase/transferase n=1 Tax=Halomicrococcus sp. SG-WS-1 TaxID=3439057 RepID=UPI003F7B0940
MYEFSQLRRGLENPNLFAREANRLYHRRLNTRQYNEDGIDVMAEDWDNLLILDACRYDMFEANANLPGRLESRESRGSATVEFLRANFTNRDVRDTVYVTANPQLHRNFDRINPEFHAIENVWLEDGWDEQYQTVLPETTTEYALDAAEEYDNKRFIVHYIQPHYPFITEETSFDKGYLDDPESDSRDFWGRKMESELDVSAAEIWQSYTETLNRTLPHVERLMDELDGKTVVTADHGNMVGERATPFPVREWGHPRGMYTDELVRVPWLVDDRGERREVVAEDATESEAVDDDVVADRLKQLGYAE